MGYKDFRDSYSFADLAVGKSLENSRSLKRLARLGRDGADQQGSELAKCGSLVDGIL